MERESDFISDVLKIALGIVLGGIFLFLLQNAYLRLQVKAGENELNKTSPQVQRKGDESRLAKLACDENNQCIEVLPATVVTRQNGQR